MMPIKIMNNKLMMILIITKC